MKDTCIKNNIHGLSVPFLQRFHDKVWFSRTVGGRNNTVHVPINLCTALSFFIFPIHFISTCVCVFPSSSSFPPSSPLSLPPSSLLSPSPSYVFRNNRTHYNALLNTFLSIPVSQHQCHPFPLSLSRFRSKLQT